MVAEIAAEKKSNQDPQRQAAKLVLFVIQYQPESRKRRMDDHNLRLRFGLLRFTYALCSSSQDHASSGATKTPPVHRVGRGCANR